jgi:hypothetical protein
MLRTFGFSTLLLVFTAAVAPAQVRDRPAFTCEDTDGWNDDRASHCEIREETIAGGNPLDVDAGSNGGIRVHGWERSEVLVRARIVGTGDTDAEARQMVSQVRLEAAGGQVRARGPEQQGDRHWTVSYDRAIATGRSATTSASRRTRK